MKLTGRGIDFNALKNGQDTEFEVKEPGAEEDDFDWEDENDKIDYEHIFRYRNSAMLGLDDEQPLDSNNNQEAADSSSKTPFEILKMKMFDITPEKNGGVLKRKLVPGEGPAITNGARVRSNHICNKVFF